MARSQSLGSCPVVKDGTDTVARSPTWDVTYFGAPPVGLAVFQAIHSTFVHTSEAKCAGKWDELAMLL